MEVEKIVQEKDLLVKVNHINENIGSEEFQHIDNNIVKIIKTAIKRDKNSRVKNAQCIIPNKLIRLRKNIHL